jgi:Bardet-Biedl syndrome 9 protein
VGEHTLFVMDLRGQVIMQKRLEYHPAACCCYPVPPVASAPGGEENLLVATHTKALLVYRGNTLAWSARTEIQPVAVKVGSQ